MTSIEITIIKIRQKLISAFALLDSALDRDDLLQQRGDGDTILHQLEHVLFASQVMIPEIESAVAYANSLYRQGQHKPGRYQFNIDHFKTILHEVDAGRVTTVHIDLQSSPETLRLLLRDQLYRCLRMLDQLSTGQGKLVTVTLSFSGVQPMDPYQALYLVAVHIHHRIKTIFATKTECLPAQHIELA